MVRSGALFALGLAAGFGLLLGPARADDPQRPDKDGEYSSDPSIGTLPMVGDPGAPDQAITLRGSTEAIRAAIRSLQPAEDGDVTAWTEPIVFGDGTAWLRVYGDVEVTLDVSALDGVEIGVFSGFEGGGMAYVAQTSAGLVRGDDLHAGEEFEIDAYRLMTGGLLDAPVRVHCAHAMGPRATVGLIWAPGNDALVIRQDV